MKVCSGTIKILYSRGQIGLGQQKDRIATCLIFIAPPARRLMGAIFITDCGNLLHDPSVISIRQIIFLPELQLFITVAESHLLYYSIGLEGSPVQPEFSRKKGRKGGSEYNLDCKPQKLPEIL
jgi:hypothetical protein